MHSCFRYFVVVITFGLLTVGNGSSVFAHNWVNVSGNFSVEAEFIALEDGMVKLKKGDGHIVVVPLEQLSKECQEQAKQLAAGSENAPKSNTQEPHDTRSARLLCFLRAES